MASRAAAQRALPLGIPRGKIDGIRAQAAARFRENRDGMHHARSALYTRFRKQSTASRAQRDLGEICIRWHRTRSGQRALRKVDGIRAQRALGKVDGITKRIGARAGDTAYPRCACENSVAAQARNALAERIAERG